MLYIPDLIKGLNLEDARKVIDWLSQNAWVSNAGFCYLYIYQGLQNDKS